MNNLSILFFRYYVTSNWNAYLLTLVKCTFQN